MKYILIQISGGLGNQLFQLANAYNLSIKYNRKLLICDKNSFPRDTYWNNLFINFKENLISLEKYGELKERATSYNWAMYRFEYKNIELNDNIEYYCIEGYYQSYKYFQKDDFYNMLSFNNCDILPSNKDVAVHIRRTDYLNNNFHKVLSLDYYYNSLKEILKKTDINKIHIFSDDINWCKNNFSFKNIPIYFNNLTRDIDEMFLMSHFNNIIIANSSFSWWAAYLPNSTNEKLVYAPTNWFNNGCHLNIKDLRPNNWNVIDDDLKFYKNENNFDKNKFNIISLGSACCMVQNIHDNVYSNLGPLFRQPDNATNFFDWLITDFKFIVYLFENLMFKDDSFLSVDDFTFLDINANPKQLQGGWSNVYRKVEFKDKDMGSMISLHDVKKETTEIPNEFIEKYKRRFERLYDKIKNNDTIHLMHCFDFQWLKPYFPLVSEIDKIFAACKMINPTCDIKLYFFVHPNYHDNPVFKDYKFIDNVKICFLKNKGFHADWKANNLTFDDFFKI